MAWKSCRVVAMRVRVGDFRIVYRIDDDVLTVPVLKVGNRKEIYRSL